MKNITKTLHIFQYFSILFLLPTHFFFLFHQSAFPFFSSFLSFSLLTSIFLYLVYFFLLQLFCSFFFHFFFSLSPFSFLCPSLVFFLQFILSFFFYHSHFLSFPPCFFVFPSTIFHFLFRSFFYPFFHILLFFSLKILCPLPLAFFNVFPSSIFSFSFILFYTFFLTQISQSFPSGIFASFTHLILLQHLLIFE